MIFIYIYAGFRYTSKNYLCVYWIFELYFSSEDEQNLRKCAKKTVNIIMFKITKYVFRYTPTLISFPSVFTAK